MKLGVFNPVLYDKTFDEALDKIKALGLDAIEIGCGNYPGDNHCKPKQLLEDLSALNDFKRKIEERGLLISALSCHGNPLHPSETISTSHREAQRNTIKLAEKLGVTRVNVFSGCPGDSEHARYPNWVTCSWPEDYPKILEWQWRQRVIPFWSKEADFAEENGVDKICVEMHPGFVVYNPETMLELRKAVGKVIGVNYDPSHMFWQGIDPCAAIIKLRDCMYHFHAKDTYIDPQNSAINGILDLKSVDTNANLAERSRYFRTVGYGHDALTWKRMISTLVLIGYDHVVSIEHEDPLMSRDEGLRRAAEFLKQILITESPAWM